MRHRVEKPVRAIEQIHFRVLDYLQYCAPDCPLVLQKPRGSHYTFLERSDQQDLPEHLLEIARELQLPIVDPLSNEPFPRFLAISLSGRQELFSTAMAVINADAYYLLRRTLSDLKACGPKPSTEEINSWAARYAKMLSMIDPLSKTDTAEDHARITKLNQAMDAITYQAKAHGWLDQFIRAYNEVTANRGKGLG